ncbi:ABC transporter ATP-binding protein [Herbaspirillum autotrophicum]|uniref:ABC transporter ATP-binding protein n=1 Tax=Herbaspirillum autotrophicum TaxID=180195 RepID=UPI00067C66B9|nr:ABC transporter ATP-binding protein [Herbaspirillum autotrophicum]
MRNIWRVIRFIPEYRGRILGVFVVGTVLGAVSTATPFLYKHIVDVIAALLSGQVSAQQASASVAVLLSLFFGLRVLMVLFSALQDKQSDDLWLDTVSTFRQRVFDNMTRMSIDYFEKKRVGEIMDRFGHITTITMWLFSLTEGTLANILQLFFIVAMLLWKAPVIGLIMVAVVALNLLLSYRTVHATQPYRRGWQRLAGRMSGLLAEMISNVATVRSFGGEPAVKQRYDDTQAEWKLTRDALHKLEWRASLWLNLANAAGLCLTVGLAAHGALNGRFSPGDVLFVLTLAQNLINTIAPISRQLNQMGDIESNAERLAELLDAPAQLADRPDAIPLQGIDTIVFDHVSFCYPGQSQPTLHDISFSLCAGQALALVGPSGGGKTTIVKLLMGFYAPGSGTILINGRDLLDYQQASVRALMGVVLQDVALFNDSIAENIAFAKVGVDLAQIQAASALAYADEFISRLPQAYNTMVGERGVKLSGGEKQRIAIARAILKNPQLIILDEATSALDSASEHLVQQGLETLVSGRSSIIIAHRLSTIRSADLILVMQDGCIVERGIHAELERLHGGLYARLYALQGGAPVTELAA